MTAALQDPAVPSAGAAPSGPAVPVTGVGTLGRNALWLMASSAGTALLGLVYWAVAGHRYSVDQLGRDGAVITAMIGVSAIGQLNLPAAVLRFLPALGPARVRLVVTAFAATTLASALAAGAALGLFRHAVEGLEAATTNASVAAAFVVGTALWSVFVLQDSVLVALRRTAWVPLENISFAVLKIVLLVAFAGSLGGFGLFFSWTVAMLVVLVPVNVWVNVLVRRSRHEPVRRSEVLDRLGTRGAARMVGVDYAAAVVGQAYAQFLPVVVLATAGTAASAAFIVPFTAATALDTLVLALLQSFTAEAARDETRTAYLARATAVRVGVLVGAGTLAVLVAAPLLLRPFGMQDGGLGTELLRIVVLACAGRAVLALFEAVCRMRGRTGLILLVQVLVGAGALIGAVAGGRAAGATGVAWAWVAVHLGLALAVTPMLLALLRDRRGGRHAAAGHHRPEGATP